MNSLKLLLTKIAPSFLRWGLTVASVATLSAEMPSVVGEWQLDDGSQVTAHDDQTAEVLNPQTGVREKVGEWRQQSGGECLFAWKGGDRHLMKLAPDGGTMEGNFQQFGRLTKISVSARRMEAQGEDVEETTGYFGSTSPHGGSTAPTEEEESGGTDESGDEPHASLIGEEASSGDAEEGIADGTPGVERSETQAVLLPADAQLSGELMLENSSGAIANWKSPEGSATWSVAHLKPGKYQIAIEHSVGMGRNGGRFEVSTDSAKVSSSARTTGGWKMFKRKPVGAIEISESDTELRLTATSVESGGSLMNIRSVELRRE